MAAAALLTGNRSVEPGAVAGVPLAVWVQRWRLTHHLDPERGALRWCTVDGRPVGDVPHLENQVYQVMGRAYVEWLISEQHV